VKKFRLHKAEFLPHWKSSKALHDLFSNRQLTNSRVARDLPWSFFGLRNPEALTMTAELDTPKKDRIILWFREIRNKDVSLVGGKAASLGEMIGELQQTGLKVPDGFAVTVNGYNLFLNGSPGLQEFISEKIQQVRTAFLNLQNAKEKISLEPTDQEEVIPEAAKKEYEESNRAFQLILEQTGAAIRERFTQASLPDALTEEIARAYKELSQEAGLENVSVAVRSSATAEDLPDASFAGQQDTFLNVSGFDKLKDACLHCFASLFTNRAISYREDQHFIQLTLAAKAKEQGDLEQTAYHQRIAEAVDHFNVGLSIAVQLMVRSDLASSGVIFSIDTESGFDQVVYITAAFGLGEFVVQGRVNPDQHWVFKPTMTIADERPGVKDIKLVYSENGVCEEVIPGWERKKYCLAHDEVLKLAEWAMIIEKHYQKAMDIEWAKDGLTNELYIVQARPETVHSTKGTTEIYQLLERPKKTAIEGEAVGNKIGQGMVHIIKDASKISEFVPGEVLVTVMTDPDWEPIMKVAAAIVTNRGGRTCHAAIVSRELGIPCVIGTEYGTEVLKTDQDVTVDCSEGQGLVYDGLLPFKVSELDPTKVPKTRTTIMLNIGIPEQAFIAAHLPHSGVGLGRVEFIINSHIQIHPLALVQFKDLELIGVQKGMLDYARSIKMQIESLTEFYLDKAEFFVDRLAYGIGRISAAFYPKPVIIRLSDFKTNEYANLIGGKLFEPEESNPMIGWRGCSRYYDKRFEAGFILECRALAKVRNDMKLHNVVVMLPFCRTPAEAELVRDIMKEHGLVQGEPEDSPLQLYCMAEIPSNVILADKFSNIVDGFSIGSNDLTQLTLGLDRDSELVSHIFDERDLSVKRMISQLIQTAHEHGRKVGICGQGPSDFPSFAAFLVENHIDSMSLNPDTLVQTKALAYLMEKAQEAGISYEAIDSGFIEKTLRKYGDGLTVAVEKMINQERQKIAKEKRIMPHRPERL
jgi:pyruvate,water dikinase